jgi:hypothetical protein
VHDNESVCNHADMAAPLRMDHGLLSFAAALPG